MKAIVRLTFAAALPWLLVAAPASAAQGPVVDCGSAARDPAIPYEEYEEAYVTTCETPFFAEEGPKLLAADGATVRESRQLMDDVSFDGVPQWTDEEIMAQFTATRDLRYMHYVDEPDFARRISWLYPDDGCFARAEQVVGLASDDGLPKPYKLWTFGPLRVHTENHPSGLVTWGWHVVPLVLNSDGEPVVLDAAISPCRPLHWQEWLATMADELSLFNDPSSSYRVSISDHSAYFPGDQAFDDPGGPTHREQSLQHEEFTYLAYELFRQEDLGRDPAEVLGPNPPWLGDACVYTEVVYDTVDIPANDNVIASAECPFGTLSVGGGLMSSSAQLVVTRNAKTTNGWEVGARNTSPSMQSLSASAVCLTGAPEGASVTTVTGSTSTVPSYGTGTSTASCSAGVLLGGGFATTIGGAAALKVHESKRTTISSNTWQVSAYNTTGSAGTVIPYAYCLDGTSFTMGQSSGGLSPEGIAMAGCPVSSITLGGGFGFPWYMPYNVVTMANQGAIYAVDMLPSPEYPDPNAKAYAQCMTVAASTPTCTEATATELGGQQSATTVAGDGCLKITQYPGSWVQGITLQAQANGSGYPIPYSWTSCAGGGSGSISGDWSESSIAPVSSACTTLIDLTGSELGSVTLTWWATG